MPVLVLFVAVTFTASLPSLHLRPYQQFAVPTLVEVKDRPKWWYDVPVAVRPEFSVANETLAPVGDHRAAWFSFILVGLIAAISLHGNTETVTVRLVRGFVEFNVAGAVALPLVVLSPMLCWEISGARLSIRMLLLITAACGVVFALLSTAP